MKDDHSRYIEARNKSERLAREYVIPTLNEYVKQKYPNQKCLIETVESLDESLARLLDMNTGADLYYKRDEMVWFIALRISQPSTRKEFDIRYAKDNHAKTEYEKRVEALLNKAVRPTWNIQAHISGNSLVMGVVDSDRLFRYLRTAEQNKTLHTDRWSDATRCVVGWDELEEHGIHVTVIEKQLQSDVLSAVV